MATVNKTFRIETDAQGEPLVHRVDGRHPKRHYTNTNHTMEEVLDELQFDIHANVYLTVIDHGVNTINSGGPIGGKAAYGVALVPSSMIFTTIAHELGHTFDLSHDFSDDTYIMSYGHSNRSRLSACHAEFLSVNPYFNPNSSVAVEGGQSVTIEIISPHIYPVGSASVSIRVKVGSSQGLHQVLLLGRTKEPHSGAGGFEVKTCRGLAGEKDAVVEFEYDGTLSSSPFSSLSAPPAHELIVKVVDADGNSAERVLGLAERSSYQIATLAARTDVYSVSFSPDGTLLASGSGRIELWDVASRQQVTTLPWRGNYVFSVSFSPDGTLLASGSWDGPIELWDVASRQQVTTLEGHMAAVESVSFSPDGTLLASGSRDGTVQLWGRSEQTTSCHLNGAWDGCLFGIIFSGRKPCSPFHRRMARSSYGT